MPIIYNDETKQFYLHTESSSYIIELLDGRIPMHAYWGETLRNMVPMVSWESTKGQGFLAKDTGLDNYAFASTGTLSLEYPLFGSGDMREPAFHALYEDGSRITCLEYSGHKIIDGKPALEGLPATYSDGDKVETLELYLKDKLTGLEICLYYSVFEEKNAIARSVRAVNRGEKKIKLLRADSASVDFYDCDMELVHLHGLWGRERHIERVKTPVGIQRYDSKRGASSHAANPFIALAEPCANEICGNVYAMSLVYSGSWEGIAEKDPFNSLRLNMGINSFDFCWALNPGESLQLPEVILVHSSHGFGEMSRIYHRLYRDNLIRGKFKRSPRPVLVNNWEATYFNFTEEKLLEIAESAKNIGIDLLVLDDGWFGKRNDAKSSLGDWVTNAEKLPDGLRGLGEKITAKGLQFGIWMEPEMVSPDSDLYRKHPDWCIHVNGRNRSLTRCQLILDLSRREVCDYIIEAVTNVLKSAPVSYVKWDMNRNISESGSAGLAPENQGELHYRYILGLYSVLETLTSRFPDVLFEGCSGGGGRFDAGMLYYFPQIWCSDDTDAIERLYIQYGTSMVYPVNSMGSHVSACPNHQLGRVTPFSLRGNVAMSGQFGYELDLSKLDENETETAKCQVEFYKAHRNTIHYGDMYRLISPFEEPLASWEFISENKSEVILFMCVISAKCDVPPKRIKLQGVGKNAVYREKKSGMLYSGEFLMRVGYPFQRSNDRNNEMIVFERVEE